MLWGEPGRPAVGGGFSRERLNFPKMVRVSYDGSNRQSNCLDDLVARESSACCGVNLAVQRRAFGGGFFPGATEFPEMVWIGYDGSNRQSNCLDDFVARESSACCGVNLAVQRRGVGFSREQLNFPKWSG